MPGWNEATNVLCVRLDALGDVLMTTPALRALKASHPRRRLTLLTSASGAEVARFVPELDGVIAYAAPWMKATPPRADSRVDLEMIDRLRGAAFDAAVIFTVYSQNPLPAALACFLADIPLRLAHARENPYQLLTQWVCETEPASGIRHEAQRQLDLVATVGCRAADERLSLRVDASDVSRVRKRLARLPLRSPGRLVVVHPGASAPSRRYPAGRFAEVARQLATVHGCDVVFTGSEGERDLVDQVRRAMGAPSASLAGALPFGELAALIAEARLLVSNNTGPVHVAAAVGTPVVDLYALTNPQHTPWRVESRVLFHDVPCRYCYKSICPEGHHDCLQRVRPADVVAAACDLLDAGHARPAIPLPPVRTGTAPAASPQLASDLAPGGTA
jgi:lipopolysaccharide heptosyltransferase II